ncbi:hypothetical protein [Salimicrobium halophilum]|uniref:Resolvase HTH domain-containing protein n=1 Tax=Salimicrobium halophilum TaxID=86666 RepID=A0A1G8PS04_9BACI|nr:hypothetical protein [Salimicrobium halophilum]SDI95304.1 hypothetical protein SAMN04490247_0166 [Salimicrobium halophilum]
MIETVLLSVGAVALLLFIVSFFTTNSFKKLEDEIEQTQLQSMQEMYTLKKKVRILEEELLHTSAPEPSSVAPSLIDRVTQLQKEGHSVREISELTQVNEHDIYALLHQNSSKGVFS